MLVEPLGNMAVIWSKDLSSRCLLDRVSTTLQVFITPHPQSGPVPDIWYVPILQTDLILWEEVNVMLRKGSVEVVKDRSPGFYSRLFLWRRQQAAGGQSSMSFL